MIYNEYKLKYINDFVQKIRNFVASGNWVQAEKTHNTMLNMILNSTTNMDLRNIFNKVSPSQILDGAPRHIVGGIN